MVALPDSAKIHSRYDTGSPCVVDLVAPLTLHAGDGERDAVPCAPGMVHLHADGRLAYAAVAEACVVGGVSLVPGDAAYFHENGAVRLLVTSEPRRLAGRDGAHAVAFDEAGRVERVSVGDAEYDAAGDLVYRCLREREIIDGVVCAPGPVLFDGGRLSSATLGAPLATPFGDLPPGSLVQIAADGLLQATAGATCVLGGVTFERGDPVRFTSQGPVRRGWVFQFPWVPPAATS